MPENTHKEENNLKAFDFSNQNIPTATESRNTSEQTFVTWGGAAIGQTNFQQNYDINGNNTYYNLYPNFLLKLYRDSPIHGAIINQKANYIVGSGLKMDNKDIDVMVNPSDSLKEFISKIILDYLIFNAFSVEVLFNVQNEPIEFHHVPFQNLRMNVNKDLFFYSKDWRYYKWQNTFERYQPQNNQDANSKIFFYDGYSPSENRTYPTPEYTQVIRPITTDVAINEFNLNNIENQFSVSSIITFYNGGNVTDDVKRQNIDQINRTYKGQNGKKIMVDFQSKDGKAADVKPLTVGDWDKSYLQVYNNTIDAIIIGHGCQSGALFGISQPGKLGSNQELELSYKAFKDNYISVKRSQIQSALMQMFSEFKPILGVLEFQDKDTFKQEIDKNKLLYYTIDELRAIDNLAPLPNGDGARLLSAVKPPLAYPTPQAPSNKPDANAVPDPSAPQATVAPEQQSEEVKKKSNSRKLTEEDYEKIKHLGLSAGDFDIVEKMIHKHTRFSTESDIADYLISNDIKGLTIEEVVDLLGKAGIETTADDVQDVLTSLNESGIADVETDDEGKIKVTPNPKPEIPDSDAVSVMYKYVLRDDIDGDDLLPTSRSFCVKLIENDRLYTREDIQSMGAIFGYDIYKYCGGFYHNPETDETTPYCRHQWQALRVSPKRKAN